MKNVFFLLCLALTYCGQAQEMQTIKKKLQFAQSSSQNTLIVENLNGNIQVESYGGQDILLEVDLKIDAQTDAIRRKAKEEVKLGIVQKEDLMVVFMDNPCANDHAELSKEALLSGRSMFWRNNCNWSPEYSFNMDYRLKVPKKLNVWVSTINQGDIEVKGVQGHVKAINVNGGIKLEQIAGKTKAHTINGPVDISYAMNPKEDCEYYSLNGNIDIRYQAGMSANVSFESMHGDLMTSINEVELLPASTTKSEKREKGIKYKIGGAQRLKIRQGGPQLSFETLNGNVYIRETK